LARHLGITEAGRNRKAKPTHAAAKLLGPDGVLAHVGNTAAGPEWSDATYEAQQRDALARALAPDSYQHQAAARSGCSVETFAIRTNVVSLDEFRAYMGRDPE
jgi:hypothetical protein